MTTTRRPRGAKPSRTTRDPAGARPPARRARRGREAVAPPGPAALDAHELDELREELERTVAAAATPRWNADPDDVQCSVARLVLALVEFVRKLLERQAIRRVEAGTLSDEETERLGVALMRLEETIHDMARRFGIDPRDLNLDLGPLGRLM